MSTSPGCTFSESLVASTSTSTYGVLYLANFVDCLIANVSVSEILYSGISYVIRGGILSCLNVSDVIVTGLMVDAVHLHIGGPVVTEPITFTGGMIYVTEFHNLVVERLYIGNCYQKLTDSQNSVSGGILCAEVGDMILLRDWQIGNFSVSSPTLSTGIVVKGGVIQVLDVKSSIVENLDVSDTSYILQGYQSKLRVTFQGIISVLNYRNVTFRNCVFRRNRVEVVDSFLSGYINGGVFHVTADDGSDDGWVEIIGNIIHDSDFLLLPSVGQCGLCAGGVMFGSGFRVSIHNTTITSQNVEGSRCALGGSVEALMLLDYRSIDVRGSEFRENTLRAGDGATSNGGAAYSAAIGTVHTSSCEIEDTVFVGNVMIGGNAPQGNAGLATGLVTVVGVGDCSLTIRNCTFANNVALGGNITSPQGVLGIGGEVFGTVVFSAFCAVDFENVHMIGNYGQGGFGVQSGGPALHLFQAQGQAKLRNTVIRDNVFLGGNAGNGVGGDVGPLVSFRPSRLGPPSPSLSVEGYKCANNTLIPGLGQRYVIGRYGKGQNPIGSAGIALSCCLFVQGIESHKPILNMTDCEFEGNKASRDWTQVTWTSFP